MRARESWRGWLTAAAMLTAMAVGVPASAQTAAPAPQSERARAWWATVSTLAADDMEGREAGSLVFAGTPQSAGAALFAALEGALLTARSCEDPRRYRRASAWLIDALDASTRPGRTP